MLTGQELYYYERAGYFVRREAISPARLTELQGGSSRAALAEPQVADAIGDLCAGRAYEATELASDGERVSEWRRETGVTALGETARLLGELARSAEVFCVRIALEPDETLLALPGTHSAPAASEQALALAGDPITPVPGEVRIRLAPGDVLFYSANLLTRLDLPTSGESRALAWQIRMGESREIVQA